MEPAIGTNTFTDVIFMLMLNVLKPDRYVGFKRVLCVRWNFMLASAGNGLPTREKPNTATLKRCHGLFSVLAAPLAVQLVFRLQGFQLVKPA